MSFIIDVILVAIIAVSAFLAFKKGFIGTLFSLVSTIAAIALSLMLCAPVGAYVGGALDAVDVVIARNYDRAAPNGSGS